MIDLSAIDGSSVPLDELDEDSRFLLVANGRRRTILDVLDRASGANATTLGELASDIDRLERSDSGDKTISKERLLVELHHVHLPMLDNAGLIEYRPESKRINRVPERLLN